MSQFDTPLPYYREYIEQIVRPRVSRLIEEVRARLSDQVWGELLARVAEDQKPGSAADPQTIETLRALLSNTLGLQLSVQLSAQFQGIPATGFGPSGAPGSAATTTASNGQEVVNQSFPNNPLARAVGGLKRAGQ